MRVELIYDTDCPNVAETRANLLKAFAAAGLKAKWTEWERSSRSSPAYAARFGSPTVLVNRHDIADERPGKHPSCYRLYISDEGRSYGTPSVEVIKTALTAATFRVSEKATDWKRPLWAFPGVVLSVLPIGSCPACWPIYAGVLSSVGIGFLLSSTYLLPLTALFLLAAVLPLAFRAKASRGYGPFAFGMVAAMLILWGKFSLESNVMASAGAGLLSGCSLWNSWPRHAANRCSQCTPSGADPVHLSAMEKSS